MKRESWKQIIQIIITILTAISSTIPSHLLTFSLSHFLTFLHILS